jgi:hypothetical protein
MVGRWWPTPPPQGIAERMTASPPDTLPCHECGEAVAVQSSQCPACGVPVGWPNVRIAVAQRPWLMQRADEARLAALSAHKEAALARLEQVAATTRAVWSAPVEVARQLLSDDRPEAAAYGGLLLAGARRPARLDDDRIRAMVEGWLFGTQPPGSVRYAALAADHVGLRSYGLLSITLRDNKMRHAATTLSRNSWTLFSESPPLQPPPPGHASTWEDRAAIVIAKLAPDLSAGTTERELPALLLRQGAAGRGDDEFIEVHRWGPFGRSAFERVTENAAPADAEEATLLDHARERAARLGIPWTCL